MTTVPVPSAALTVGRQGNYAGAMSRLAAFAADVGASWGIYTLGVALFNAALKLVTAHSYPLNNHQLAGFIDPDGLGVPLFHLPVGGQRENTRHGHPRAAGGDEARRAHQRAAGRFPDRGARVHLALHARHRVPRHRLPAGPTGAQRLHRGNLRRLRLGRPGGSAALDRPQGRPQADLRPDKCKAPSRGGRPGQVDPGHSRLRDSSLGTLRCRVCPSPRSPGHTPTSPSSPSTGRSA